MLSVIFATHNRAAKLSAVLDAYTRLQSPEDGWHVFVVDNASTDHTRQVVETFRDQLPLTYLFEPRKGKNFALNLAVPLIQGDIVIFTDDDALPRADWLVQMRRAADANPEFSIFAGVVLPKWEVPAPEWILSWVPLTCTYTLTRPHLKEGPITYEDVFGPNMALRARIFQDGVRYDASIGPKGKQYAMGSETELVIRLTNAGYKAWHCQQSVVEHLIDQFQMTEEWLMGRAFRFGRGQSRLETILPEVPLRRWFGVPRYLFRAMGTDAARFAWATLKRNRQERFAANWALHLAAGMVVEASRMQRDKTTRARRDSGSQFRNDASNELNRAAAAAPASWKQE